MCSALVKKTHFSLAEIEVLPDLYFALYFCLISSVFVFDFICDWGPVWVVSTAHGGDRQDEQKHFQGVPPQHVKMMTMMMMMRLMLMMLMMTMRMIIFREFLHNVFKMTDDILMDRIFKYFDSLNNGLITREEWILGLNIFLRGENQTKDCVLKLRWPGSVDEHIEYCFTIYDLNADGWEYQTPSPHLVHYCTLSLFDIWVSRQSAEWEPPICGGAL